MTIICIPEANAQANIERRRGGAAPVPLWLGVLRRLAARTRNALRDRQRMVTLSEQVLADIHNVHSLQR